MIQAIHARLAARKDENSEGGFTLIELMVVVMIIAILVGIAIPAFLGARKRAQDTAVKSNLRNGLSTAQTIFTDNQAYFGVAAGANPITIGATPVQLSNGNLADVVINSVGSAYCVHLTRAALTFARLRLRLEWNTVAR